MRRKSLSPLTSHRKLTRQFLKKMRVAAEYGLKTASHPKYRNWPLVLCVRCVVLVCFFRAVSKKTALSTFSSTVQLKTRRQPLRPYSADKRTSSLHFFRVLTTKWISTAHGTQRINGSFGYLGRLGVFSDHTLLQRAFSKNRPVSFRSGVTALMNFLRARCTHFSESPRSGPRIPVIII